MTTEARSTLEGIDAATVAAVVNLLADEMEMVIISGDVAEVAASVPGEYGRGMAVERRDNLYEEPVTWLREFAHNLQDKDPFNLDDYDNSVRINIAYEINKALIDADNAHDGTLANSWQYRKGLESAMEIVKNGRY